jgi:uridylate kinase
MGVYRRVLLKLSGEALSGDRGYGLHVQTIERLCEEIGEVVRLGCQIGIVVGGGNFVRGTSLERHGIERQIADYMGMVATYINALAMEDFLKRKGTSTRIYGALSVEKLTERWNREGMLEDLKSGRVLIFAGGTGNPYFSTDTAAILRASEIEAEVVLKATKVDGVFDKDPLLHKDARFFSEISYLDALKMQVQVMDLTAIALAMERGIPVIVFNMKVKDNLKKVIMKEPIGTIVRG